MSSLFQQKKEEIAALAKQSLNKNGQPKRTFSKTQFNDLAAAYLNSPDYVDEQLKTKAGEATIVETTPVKDFRESVIGGIAKAAGLDKSEQEKLVDSYQFSGKTDYHSFMSNVIEAYASDDCYSKFTMNPRTNMVGSIVIETVPATTKEVKTVSSGEVKTVHYGEYRKVKAKSTCPKGLRSNA